MRLLFVGDGKRDAQTVPLLVEGILGIPIEPETRNWFRLHGRGYDGKMLYSLRVARDRCVSGLVATVDRDRDKPYRRLKALENGLTQDREKNLEMPTALGEAAPHGEAWLLDDAVAVREALGLPSSLKIPAVGTGGAKAKLNKLISESSHSPDHMTALREIARAVEVSRCKGAKKTGLAAFAEEVTSELGPIADGRSSAS